MISAAKGTEVLIDSLVESNRLDDAEQMAIVMIDRLETALAVAEGEPDLLARKLGLDLHRARLRQQRRNPSLGDVDSAERRRVAVRSELESALDSHPDHPELRFLAAMLDLADSDAIRLGSRATTEMMARKQALLKNALVELGRAESDGGSTFSRQRAMIGTNLGDVLKKQGELAAALDAYEKSHASHSKRDVGYERDLAVLETRMASTHTAMGDDARAVELHRRSLERRERLSDNAARIESARARRDLAIGHLYLSEALRSSSPANAKRHLEQYLDLTFEVAWLDPLDNRGAVVDLEKAMARASRLGDVKPFAITIARFRDSIVEPRLQTLPGIDSRRLAVRADRYLAEASLHFAGEASDEGRPDESDRYVREATRRLDDAIEVGRVLVEIDRSRPEVVAEVGLCIAYRVTIEPDGSDRIDDWIEEATELLEFAREAGGDGPIRRKLDDQLANLSSAPEA